MPGHFPKFTMALPDWIESIVRPGEVFKDRLSRMRMAIRLASENVGRNTGGPFGAAIFEFETGRLISVGVNVVESSRCSIAHAEALAIALAQQSLVTHDLASRSLPALELVTSAQPCCQCFGMIWWSGLRGLVVGARAEDVESIAGFREGPLPDGWADRLRGRRGLLPIGVEVDVLRDEAIVPLQAFLASGRSPYNPGAS